MTAPKDALVDEIVECARLLGSTEAKKGYGAYTRDDSLVEVAMRKRISRLRNALAASAPEQAGEPVATTLGPDPTGDPDDSGVRFSAASWARLADLPAGTNLYTHRPADAADSKGVGDGWCVEDIPGLPLYRAERLELGEQFQLIDKASGERTPTIAVKEGGSGASSALWHVLHALASRPTDTPQHGGDAVRTSAARLCAVAGYVVAAPKIDADQETK